MESYLRLPLDLLLIHDVEALEESINCKYAIENDGEIIFCHDTDELEDYQMEFGDNMKFYQMDEIERDRIKAVIDLLNKAEEDNYLGHLLDRLVR